MILNKSNETFEYEGKKYRIGDNIVATEVSGEYEGLIGYITEIRDGDDKRIRRMKLRTSIAPSTNQ